MFFQLVATYVLIFVIFYVLNKIVRKVWKLPEKKTIKSKKEKLYDIKEKVTDLNTEINITSKLTTVEEVAKNKTKELNKLDRKRNERNYL